MLIFVFEFQNIQDYQLKSPRKSFFFFLDHYIYIINHVLNFKKFWLNIDFVQLFDPDEKPFSILIKAS